MRRGLNDLRHEVRVIAARVEGCSGIVAHDGQDLASRENGCDCSLCTPDRTLERERLPAFADRRRSEINNPDPASLATCRRREC